MSYQDNYQTPPKSGRLLTVEIDGDAVRIHATDANLDRVDVTPDAAIASTVRRAILAAAGLDGPVEARLDTLERHERQNYARAYSIENQIGDHSGQLRDLAARVAKLEASATLPATAAAVAERLFRLAKELKGDVGLAADLFMLSETLHDANRPNFPKPKAPQ